MSVIETDTSFSIAYQTLQLTKKVLKLPTLSKNGHQKDPFLKKPKHIQQSDPDFVKDVTLPVTLVTYMGFILYLSLQ